MKFDKSILNLHHEEIEEFYNAHLDGEKEPASACTLTFALIAESALRPPYCQQSSHVTLFL